ncbi:MAG: hypothetical protein PW792_05140 [Acidobacteriaceae bacterium]|nr:hypothetical protein [Acidobacteriaceae bacterium]
MRLKPAILFLYLGSLVACESPKKRAPISEFFSNERLKREVIADDPIEPHDYDAFADGLWLPEADQPERTLVMPEQVHVVCVLGDQTCRAYTVTLGTMKDIVRVEDISAVEYHVDSWDEHSLRASYGPTKYDKVGSSDRCHNHVLAMNFGSGYVSLSDIPTHEKGCEMFTETNAYHLARGHYYVDTSPGNDLDKPKREEAVQQKK